jgi:hypothetical protein
MKVYRLMNSHFPYQWATLSQTSTYFVASVTSCVIDFARGKQRNGDCARPSAILQVYVTCDKGDHQMFCLLHDKRDSGKHSPSNVSLNLGVSCRVLLWVFYDSHNKQQLFPWTALPSDRFNGNAQCFCDVGTAFYMLFRWAAGFKWFRVCPLNAPPTIISHPLFIYLVIYWLYPYSYH